METHQDNNNFLFQKHLKTKTICLIGSITCTWHAHTPQPWELEDHASLKFLHRLLHQRDFKLLSAFFFFFLMLLLDDENYNSLLIQFADIEQMYNWKEVHQ